MVKKRQLDRVTCGKVNSWTNQNCSRKKYNKSTMKEKWGGWWVSECCDTSGVHAASV
jgi:hypothetical protein